MSDFLAYKGIQEWWQTRRHWHTEAFARVVDGIIAKCDEPTAYSTYDLKQVVLPKDS
jgi:P2-related tail formation protein